MRTLPASLAAVAVLATACAPAPVAPAPVAVTSTPPTGPRTASRTTKPGTPAPPLATPSPRPAPTPDGGLAAAMKEYAESRPVPVGIVVQPVGGEPVAAGPWTTGVAWSTIKVPLVLAHRRADRPAAASLEMAALTYSDNAAATRMWSALGQPQSAAAQVDRVARAYSVDLHTQARTVRAGFTPFGQTEWSTIAQARFMAGMTCDPSARPTLALMGQVVDDQRWGLGRLQGARFKGGWGPLEGGGYLHRQMGVVDLGHGPVAVAIAAEAPSDEAGQAELDAAARWLGSHAQGMAGHC
ncbi:hypothetical protein GCM10027418_13000 [Mariniluteicoccus endophyticus]